MNLETIILSHLILNASYSRKVLPFIKDEYFAAREDKVLFDIVTKFVQQYNSLPAQDALLIELSNRKDVSESEFKGIKAKVEALEVNKDTSEKWLLDQTEEWCSWQAIKNAIMKSIKVVEGTEKTLDKGAIPKLLSDALAVSFDTKVGHNYTEESQDRWDRYHEATERVSTDLDMINKITAGGFPRGSLNMFMGGTGVGKSLVMCHLAASNMAAGYNVLYISLEMGEIGSPSIAERIDANLLDTPINMLKSLPRATFDARVKKMREKVKGKLIIKDYPTATASTNNFRFLLNELRLKKDFTPDIIYVDYLNICTSARLRGGSNLGSYTYVKAIAEELRGLAKEFNVPLVTATQLNREGAKNSDPNMEHASDSYGGPMTADLLVNIFSNDALRAANQYQFKQLKTRYGDMGENTRFNIGVDRSKMRLYDIGQSGQDQIDDKGAVKDTVISMSRKVDKDTFKEFV